MQDTSRCSVCGTRLVAGRCPTCDLRRWSGFVHRELVLLAVLVIVTIAAFFVTRAVAQSNEALRRRQAAAWFDAAERASRDGSLHAAVSALRRAASGDPENRRYRLALAGALAAGGGDDEARRVLLALREAEPEDPETHLQLARLEARLGRRDDARRYYQNALAGLWRVEQADERRHVRTELVQFLLSQQERARALSELLALEANLPDEVGVRTDIARLFLAAGDPPRAYDHFGRVLRLDPRNAEALAGAGEAAFALGDYARALRHLDAAPRDDTRNAELRELARLVLAGDPLAPRLGSTERRRRLRLMVAQAAQRLDACRPLASPQPDARLDALGAELRDFEAALEQPARGDVRDLAEEGLDLAYRAERAAGEACMAEPAPLDRALLLIGRRHGLEEQ